MCVCFFYTLYYPPLEGIGRYLSSTCKTDQVDFTDWMPFLPSNLIQEVSFIEKPSGEVPKAYLLYYVTYRHTLFLVFLRIKSLFSSDFSNEVKTQFDL